MPVVFRHGSLKFFFYSNEGDPREPMHIHVRGPNGEAKVWIEPVVSLMDSKDFSRRELADIIRQVIKNRTAIERAWHEHFGN
ncbi:DUF4160 domain-containing protein [Rhizobium sp. P32RR-XVIII]|uniref:DUF4160 domain-containing protein n=1 Tax=Rhizobium sp. P32RR-XVIII TaxID=2726738 RepID=UPI0014570AE1|nr:DUF4160 domain-containing protein [Rhizobium sp. P32RR-XVIII]NLS04417.1 DUF4160 domain-containing protein [Rhizobium sp. P32RR-XVIII]